MHFEQGVPVVVFNDSALAIKLVIFFLDVGEVRLRIGKLNIPVHASNLHFQDLVLGFLHDVRVARACHEVRGTVGNNEVFCGNKDGARALKDRIVVDLLEGRASKRQLEQHLL